MNTSFAENKKGVFFHTGLYTIANFFSRGLNFLLLPFYSHVIPVKEFGMYSLIISAATIISVFFHYGLNNSLTKYLSETDSDELKKKYFSNIFFLISSTSLPLFAVLLLFSNHFSELVLHNSSYVSSFNYGIISFLLLTYASLISSAYLSQEQSKKYVIKNLIASILNFFLNIVFLYYSKLGINGIFLAQIISSLVLLLLCNDIIKKYLSFNLNYELIKKILVFSYPFFFSCIFATLVEVVDRFIVNYYLGSEQTGIYYLGYRFGYILSIFVISFRNSWVPHYFNVVSKLGHEKEEYIGKVFHKLLFISIVLILTVSFFADDFIGLKIFGYSIFSSNYLESIGVIPIVLIGYLFNNLMTFYSLFPYISGKSYHFLIADFLCVVSNILFNILLIPAYGIIGAAFATLIAFLTGALYLFLISFNKVKIKYNFYQIFSLLLISFVAFIMNYAFNSILIDAIMVIIFIWWGIKNLKIDFRNFLQLT